ncbi:MAG: CRISPR-associated helicase Cas3' [Methanocorpusculum sp.]|nr:CRISPR-associated helicase Cas3' [Methanocorpusculum sp.]
MYLAHINHETGDTQTLTDHVKGVGKLCKKYGESINLPCTAELCGILHDMGKAKQEFQQYMLENNSSLRGKINHSSAGAKYLFEKYNCSKNPYDLLTSQLISLVILSHHSGLIDCISPQGTDIYLTRVNPQDNAISYSESSAGFTRECSTDTELDTLFQRASEEVKQLADKILREQKKDSAFFFGLLTRYLLSCVIDADRYDTYCFYTGQETLDTDYELEKTWDILSSTLEKHISGFNISNDIDKYRSEISASCKEFAKEKNGVYRLYVPTGGGKTLSSLRFAINHAKLHHKSRIIYAIPYTAIIDQNAQVIKKALGNDTLILEHHSNIISDVEGTDENQISYRLLTERWDSPIILTTTVQLLNTLFLGKTQSVRRMHNLSNSILIFDEVQTIPKKCLSLFNSAVNFLSEICGATVILCTATQPELSSLEKPIRLSSPPDIIKDYETLFANCKRTEIINRCVNGGYNAEELAEFVLQLYKDNKKILIILNTKRAARNLYEKLTELISDASIYHLSTNLCPRHRMDILDTVIKQLEDEDENLICVTTQLIEAGVDISFDCVVRSLAGLDSIAQAAGRCNRHGRKEIGSVYIINSREENLNKLPDIKNGQIHAERILRDFAGNPAHYNEDILSPKAVRDYYLYYFGEAEKGELDYIIEKRKSSLPVDDTLYELLSGNKNSLLAYSGKRRNLNQAFATAGKLFQVIEENTVTVLVPYREGAEIIEKLKSTHNLQEAAQLLKRAQQYSVSLFIAEEKLELNGIYQIGDSGVYATSPLCYSEEYGFTPYSDMNPIIL